MMRVRNGTDPGSSPLTRGKRAALDLLDCLQGLIPAHAGKTWSSSDATVKPSGSSPLTRGKLKPPDRPASRPGLIPAHAGKTVASIDQARPGWAHPRSRGENDDPHAWEDYDVGSSPLTRGKPVVEFAADRARGLIPAHAGKTEAARQAGIPTGAHPRSRGENSFRRETAFVSLGSSPLTRGKLNGRERIARIVGLIPAHAGKTSTRRPCMRMIEAHPRSRGENCQGPESPARRPGSSPLTRGKLGMLPQLISAGGLIPAHAGKTVQFAAALITIGAHPRSRGENSSTGSRLTSYPGSSPLTRGKLASPMLPARLQRLIPAHAGKTRTSRIDFLSSRAHPRSRGENYSKIDATWGAMGSSPLTRGKHDVVQLPVLTGRLIPAHAGKTACAGL